MTNAKIIAILVIGSVAGYAHPVTEDKALSPKDQATLRKAAQDCGLHEGTLTFVRGEVVGYDIRINRDLGDPETAIDCALSRLPPELTDTTVSAQ